MKADPLSTRGLNSLMKEGENTVAEQQKKNQNNAQEPDLNQLRKVRREKLADLQNNGKDPFAITKYD